VDAAWPYIRGGGKKTVGAERKNRTEGEKGIRHQPIVRRFVMIEGGVGQLGGKKGEENKTHAGGKTRRASLEDGTRSSGRKGKGKGPGPADFVKKGEKNRFSSGKKGGKSVGLPKNESCEGKKGKKCRFFRSVSTGQKKREGLCRKKRKNKDPHPKAGSFVTEETRKGQRPCSGGEAGHL